MTIQLGLPENHCLKPRITVIGAGGAGGNAVNNMIMSGLEGVDFVVANTDAQALDHSRTERRIQLGASITQGLGAGSRPDIGKASAEEAMEEIMEQLVGSHMVFITAGLGGGTGTGATPVVARAAREQGMLTVGVVTKPFHFEGQQRMRIAEEGMAELQQYVDTLIIIPNQNLFRVANDKTTFADAFKMADDVLYAGVRGVTDLMVQPGLINLDFADVRMAMSEMGKAMMGTGVANGERRALEAAEAAISNPLLDEVSMRGARGVLINITGGSDMTLFEVDEAANRIREEVDSEANIIFGAAFDETMNGAMRVSLVATGIEVESAAAEPASRPALTAIEGGPPARGQPTGGTPVSPRAGRRAAAVDMRTRAAAEEALTVEPVGALSPEPIEPEPEPKTRSPRPMAAPGHAASGVAVAASAETEPARNGAFVAPPRVAAPKEPLRSAPRSNGSGPVAPSNGVGGARRPSLFERMTGAAWSQRETQRQEPAIEPIRAKAPVPAAAEPVAMPEYDDMEPRPEPAAIAAQQTAAMEASRAEDSVLDIPAFLRRHKN